jgi:pimeloyl-ACP methyl ester carboxylesterase
MQPEIRYVRTTDGVNVAYATSGAGYPIFLLGVPGMGNVQSNWAVGPGIRAVSAFAKAVWHDARGSGFSGRDALDFSLDALERDLDAVADAACGERFALAAGGDTAPVAISYTINHPQRVTHLMLADAYTRQSDYAGTPAVQLEQAIREQDWRLYTETTMRVLFDLRDDLAQERAAEWRANITSEAWRLYQKSAWSWDVTDLLHRIQVPTLVSQNQRNLFLNPETGPRIAASIPGAQFLLVDDPAYENQGSIVESSTSPPAQAETPNTNVAPQAHGAARFILMRTG